MKQPENRHNWSKKINAKLVQLEREVFLAGCERAFLLFMDSCCFCQECSGTRATCQEPRMARPSPEGMCADFCFAKGNVRKSEIRGQKSGKSPSLNATISKKAVK